MQGRHTPVEQFFPPRPAATPTIYAFASTHPAHAGLLKVGYTGRSRVEGPGSEVAAATDAA
jgi:hypothetical protein